MFNDPVVTIIALLCIAVAVILLIGLAGFAKGGDFNRKHANKLMRYRVIAQGVAVIVIVLLVWLRHKGVI